MINDPELDAGMIAQRVEATRYAHPSDMPDRVFIDDLGRRWEWCGREEPETWAWRVTAHPREDWACR
jgi:hypothetical protein